MLQIQIKEHRLSFKVLTLCRRQEIFQSNFVVVAQNYFYEKIGRMVVGGNMRKV